MFYVKSQPIYLSYLVYIPINDHFIANAKRFCLIIYTCHTRNLDFKKYSKLLEIIKIKFIYQFIPLQMQNLNP